jgi:hypothetical protein
MDLYGVGEGIWKVKLEMEITRAQMIVVCGTLVMIATNILHI